MRVRAGLVGAVVAASVALPGGAAPAAITHAPRLGVLPAASGGAATFAWTSTNWSGYAVTGTALTSVTGSWVVPTVSPASGKTYSSSWVGIDGFNNSSLIQTGTDQIFANGRARYVAWWEILPAPETPIASIAVNPGDHMSASITSGALWTITITDTTTGQTFTTQQSYGGPATSAEWIEEAPTVGGRTATLAHYGSAVFDPGTVNGANPGLAAADGGALFQRRAGQVSTPSSPDADTDGFTVSYGSAAPSAPNS